MSQSMSEWFLDGKMLVLLNQLFRRSRVLEKGFLDGKSCFYKIRCLGGPESSNSAILDWKQLFLLNQVFSRSRERKIGNFELMERAVFIKYGVWEVQSAQNRLFYMENSCFYKIRCIGGSKSSKSAILHGK